MSKKQDFINLVQKIIFDNSANYAEDYSDIWENACEYWKIFSTEEEKEKPMFTDNGKLILKFLQEHTDKDMWKSKDIAEELFISSRSVSGAMRKLVMDGFAAKEEGTSPIRYSITEKGKNIEIND